MYFIHGMELLWENRHARHANYYKNKEITYVQLAKGGVSFVDKVETLVISDCFIYSNKESGKYYFGRWNLSIIKKKLLFISKDAKYIIRTISVWVNYVHTSLWADKFLCCHHIRNLIRLNSSIEYLSHWSPRNRVITRWHWR